MKRIIHILSQYGKAACQPFGCTPRHFVREVWYHQTGTGITRKIYRRRLRHDQEYCSRCIEILEQDEATSVLRDTEIWHVEDEECTREQILQHFYHFPGTRN